VEITKARKLLEADRLRAQRLVTDMEGSQQADRTAADQEGDMFDSAEPLTGEGTNNSVMAELRDHLAAIDRAEKRLDDGTYGLSVRSGRPIPDERLEADPTAELTIEEEADPRAEVTVEDQEESGI
jgi:DnaK suppressor protein